MYLLNFTSTGLLSAEYFPLTAPGSFLAIANFIFPASATDPMWLCVLRQLCDAFQVRPVQNSAFLGSGAHGKVFRVHSITLPTAALSDSASSASAVTVAASAAIGSTFALKLVDRRHQDRLDAEHLKLQRLLDSARTAGSSDSISCLPSFVSPTVHHAMDSFGPIGAGLLLQPVGKWVWAEPPSNSMTVLFDVLDALVQLHRLNVVHGDARLENLIRVDARRLVWIDFRECQLDASQELQRWWDMRTCLNSFFRHHHRQLDQEANLEGVQQAYAQFLRSDASLSSSQLTQFKQMVWDVISSR